MKSGNLTGGEGCRDRITAGLLNVLYPNPVGASLNLIDSAVGGWDENYPGLSEISVARVMSCKARCDARIPRIAAPAISTKTI